MRLRLADLERLASDTSFQPDALEKVLQLLELLEAVRGHPYLGSRLVLKGGTALNLFVLDLPRLSVDVDLNYVGAVERDTMVAERPLVEQAVQAVCGRLGLRLRRSPSDFAGGKWRLQYERAGGGPSALELDMNYLLRAPLWPATARDSLPFGPFAARGIPVVDEHELAAGKLAALLSRQASRDVFDARALLARGSLRPELLRLAFVVYGAASRRDWRTVTPDDVDMSAQDAEQRLLPLLRRDLAPARRDLESWCARLVSECRSRLGVVLPFTARERQFLERINGHGEIVPALLTDDGSMQQRIASNPALKGRPSTCSATSRARKGAGRPRRSTRERPRHGPEPRRLRRVGSAQLPALNWQRARVFRHAGRRGTRRLVPQAFARPGHGRYGRDMESMSGRPMPEARAGARLGPRRNASISRPPGPADPPGSSARGPACPPRGRGRPGRPCWSGRGRPRAPRAPSAPR